MRLGFTSSSAISEFKIASIGTTFVLEKFAKGSCIYENFFANPHR
jgi:hypothetical protein